MRDRNLAQPAHPEVARDYATAVAEAFQVGLRRHARDWDWDILVGEAVDGVERTCVSGPSEVCAVSRLQQARVLWATNQPRQGVRVAQQSMAIEPTLEAGAALMQMYEGLREYDPIVGVCAQLKDLIRAQPKEKRLPMLRECYEKSRAGSLERALAWLSAGELKEAKEFILGAEETDRYRGMLQRAREQSDQVRERTFDLDRRWNLVINARCPHRTYLAAVLNPFAEGAQLQALDRGKAVLPVSMGTVLWLFDEEKTALSFAVVDERISKLDVDCRNFRLH